MSQLEQAKIDNAIQVKAESSIGQAVIDETSKDEFAGGLRAMQETVVAFLGLAIVELILKLAGFRYLFSTIKRWPLVGKKTACPETISRICSAVDRAATYYLKHALCLQRSAVTTCLLRMYGVPAQMVIACRIMPYHGHAWVEVEGVVVNDRQKVQSFYSVLKRC